MPMKALTDITFADLQPSAIQAITCALLGGLDLRLTCKPLPDNESRQNAFKYKVQVRKGNKLVFVVEDLNIHELFAFHLYQWLEDNYPVLLRNTPLYR